MVCNTREESAVELAAEAAAKEAKPKPFMTTTQGMSGWFAVKYWWNDEEPDIGGFWEPWDTGIGRYQDEANAIGEAQDWAEAEGLEYVPRVKAYGDNCLRSAREKPPG